MALAKRCDRCGKHHDHYITYDGAAAGNAINLVVVTDVGALYRTIERFDLCPECMGELIDFLKEKNDAEN